MVRSLFYRDCCGLFREQSGEIGVQTLGKPVGRLCKSPGET